MKLENKLNELFKSFGYKKFRMSKFEEYDLYASNKDFLKSNQIITFTDLDGSLLALKPDITLSIIKNNKGDNEKLYYNEMIYRVRDHHYREIPQAGVECVGMLDHYEEAEVIALAAKALACMNDSYVLRISNVTVLQNVMIEERISSTLQNGILQAISTKNTGFIRELLDKELITKITAKKLYSIIETYAPLKEGINQLDFLVESAEGKETVSQLKRVSEILDMFGVLDHVYLDFSLVNSMDYYNGIIFQGAVADIPFTILSGGRYDRLPEKMGKKVGAIGFAIDMDVVLNARPIKRDFEGDLLITYTAEDDYTILAKTVTSLHERGIKVRTIRASALKPEIEKNYKSVMSLKEAFQEVKND